VVHGSVRFGGPVSSALRPGVGGEDLPLLLFPDGQGRSCGKGLGNCAWWRVGRFRGGGGLGNILRQTWKGAGNL